MKAFMIIKRGTKIYDPRRCIAVSCQPGSLWWQTNGCWILLCHIQMSLHFWKRYSVGNQMEEPCYIRSKLPQNWLTFFMLTLLQFCSNLSKGHLVLAHWDLAQSNSCVHLASALVLWQLTVHYFTQYFGLSPGVGLFCIFFLTITFVIFHHHVRW